MYCVEQSNNAAFVFMVAVDIFRSSILFSSCSYVLLFVSYPNHLPLTALPFFCSSLLLQRSIPIQNTPHTQHFICYIYAKRGLQRDFICVHCSHEVKEISDGGNDGSIDWRVHKQGGRGGENLEPFINSLSLAQDRAQLTSRSWAVRVALQLTV